MAVGGDSFMMNHGECPPEQDRPSPLPQWKKNKKKYGRAEEEQEEVLRGGMKQAHFE